MNPPSLPKPTLRMSVVGAGGAASPLAAGGARGTAYPAPFRGGLRRFLLAAAAIVAIGFLAVAPSVPAAAAPAADLSLTAVLVWGTDGAKPADKDFKPVAADLDRRLRRIFKWKNYFEIRRTNFVVAATKPSQVDMSRECRLEVARLPDDEVEILLIGQGKPVVKKKQRILPGETVILAGDDKDENAWFVVVNPNTR